MSRFARAMWRQALHDLDVARRAQQAGDFDWAMLAAQQAAEKGLKAVLLVSGLRAEQTHNVAGLLDALVAAEVATREQRARLNLPLARLTVAFGFARYPNAEVAEAPFDIIVREQGEEAIRDAEAVIAAARDMATELET